MNEKRLEELKEKIGKRFMEWADNYFADKNKLNQKIRKIDLNQHYRDYVDAFVSSASILNKLALYCQYNGYALNPKHLQDKKGSIRLVVNGRASICYYIENKGMKNDELKKKVESHFSDVKVRVLNRVSFRVKTLSWADIDFLHQFKKVEIKRSGELLSVSVGN